MPRNTYQRFSETILEPVEKYNYKNKNYFFKYKYEHFFRLVNAIRHSHKLKPFQERRLKH